MVSADRAARARPCPSSMEPCILRMKRDGIPGERLLVNVKDARSWRRSSTTYPLGDPGLEHVFDY